MENGVITHEVRSWACGYEKRVIDRAWRHHSSSVFSLPESRILYFQAAFPGFQGRAFRADLPEPEDPASWRMQRISMLTLYATPHYFTLDEPP